MKIPKDLHPRLNVFTGSNENRKDLVLRAIYKEQVSGLGGGNAYFLDNDEKESYSREAENEFDVLSPSEIYINILLDLFDESPGEPWSIYIEDIESKLDVKQQRWLIKRIKNEYPHLKFFITTNSAVILSELELESVWIVDKDRQTYHPELCYGLDVLEITQSLLEDKGRNEEVSKELEEINRLIDIGKFNDARMKIKMLLKITGKIPSLIGANSCLTILEGDQEELL